MEKDFQTNSDTKKPNQNQQSGLIQEVAIGTILSDQMLQENQIKKG